jgi:hypothetical protein
LDAAYSENNSGFPHVWFNSCSESESNSSGIGIPCSEGFIYYVVGSST